MNHLKRYDQAIFYNENMQKINTKDLVFSNLRMPSIPFENQWSGGEDGIAPVFVGANYQQRPITLDVKMFSVDVPDYYLLQSEMFSIFGYNTPFYIVKKYEKGKRYRAILDSNFEIERIDPMYGTAELTFITESLPFAESTGTTQDIQRDGINANSELWGFGMGLQSDPFALQYTFDVNEEEGFRVFNAGNVPIHPFEKDFKMTIKNIVNARGMVQIRNQRNMDYIRITDNDIKSSDVFVFDGANITKNGLNALRKTDRTFIGLEPGYNRFEIYHCDSATLEFDFRYYYR
ncbi:phage tail domain-containing protein [Oceanobacillus locisalsi]|uniref:Phage tail domain-containing protein n=1 Tax=Oceanobacillus locisalsi TaxID=546107 RepID=A0ABW3NG80_9BACI